MQLEDFIIRGMDKLAKASALLWGGFTLQWRREHRRTATSAAGEKGAHKGSMVTFLELRRRELNRCLICEVCGKEGQDHHMANVLTATFS